MVSKLNENFFDQLLYLGGFLPNISLKKLFES